MKKRIIIILGVFIILAMGFLILFLGIKDDNADRPPSLPNDGSYNKNLSSKSLFDSKESLVNENVKENELIGEWKCVVEELNGLLREELENCSITFNNNGRFISYDNGYIEEGIFKLDNSKIIFYDSEEYVGLEGSFNQASAIIEGNELKLIYPAFPKVVVYKK